MLLGAISLLFHKTVRCSWMQCFCQQGVFAFGLVWPPQPVSQLWGRNTQTFTSASLCQLTQHESLVALFDNRTWCRQGVADEFDYISHHQAWKHPHVNVFITLILFIIMKVGIGRLEHQIMVEVFLFMISQADSSLSVSVLDVGCGHHHARPMWGLHASFPDWWIKSTHLLVSPAAVRTSLTNWLLNVYLSVDRCSVWQTRRRDHGHHVSWWHPCWRQCVSHSSRWLRCRWWVHTLNFNSPYRVIICLDG